MNRWLSILLFVVALLSCVGSRKSIEEKDQSGIQDLPALDYSTPIQTIAFGSCNHEYDPQPMWKEIAASQPGLWIWLGDIIYGDTDDMVVLRNKYNQQLQNQDYRSFIQAVPVLGIWDDHDYGLNDGGNEYTKRDESKELMLEFLSVPKNAAVRKHSGAYQSYVIGKGNQKVKLILLDGRYFRDELKKKDGVYQQNLQGTLLGEQQWTWLDKELEGSDASIHLIGCGIQFIPEEHKYEKWANFPEERKRFFELLIRHQPKNVILLSGDRHIGEFSKIELVGLEQPLYDLTSSGLTHSWDDNPGEINRWRSGPLVKEKNYGLISIDWSGDKPSITAELRGFNGKVFHSERIQ